MILQLFENNVMLEIKGWIFYEADSTVNDTFLIKTINVFVNDTFTDKIMNASIATTMVKYDEEFLNLRNKYFGKINKQTQLSLSSNS